MILESFPGGDMPLQSIFVLEVNEPLVGKFINASERSPVGFREDSVQKRGIIRINQSLAEQHIPTDVLDEIPVGVIDIIAVSLSFYFQRKSESVGGAITSAQPEAFRVWSERIADAELIVCIGVFWNLVRVYVRINLSIFEDDIGILYSCWLNITQSEVIRKLVPKVIGSNLSNFDVIKKEATKKLDVPGGIHCKVCSDECVITVVELGLNCLVEIHG